MCLGKLRAKLRPPLRPPNFGIPRGLYPPLHFPQGPKFFDDVAYLGRAVLAPNEDMAFKRKRSSSRAGSRKGTKRARAGPARRHTGKARSALRRIGAGVQRLTRMIETKESAQTQAVGTNLPHNNITLLSTNPFVTNIGAGDPMAGTGNRIGDSIAVQGLLIKGFVEASLQRTHVHFRIMLVRGAKGEPFSRATLYKNIVDNKIIDQMNTERYTVLATKRITVNTSNAAPTGTLPSGVPSGTTSSGQSGIYIIENGITQAN